MLRPHKPSPLSLSPQHITSQKLNEPWLAVKTWKVFPFNQSYSFILKLHTIQCKLIVCNWICFVLLLKMQMKDAGPKSILYDSQISWTETGSSTVWCQQWGQRSPLGPRGGHRAPGADRSARAPPTRALWLEAYQTVLWLYVYKKTFERVYKE